MRLCAFVVIAFAVLAGCGSPEEAAPPPEVNVKTVGRAGGTVVGQGEAQGVTLVLPFGALTEDTPVAVGIDPDPPPDPPGMTPASVPVLVSPEGLALQRPATLIIPFQGFSDVTLYSAPAIAGVPWQVFDGGVADIGTSTVRASLPHFSRWRVYRVAPPDAGPLPDAG